ncbi:MAG: cytochrome c maturation protein CcmE [Acidimicrobiales bacterium]
MDVTPPESARPEPGPDGPGPDGLDLSPRTTGAVGTARRQRRWGPIVVLVLVLGGVGFVAAQALTTATTFFYNADEAVANQAKLGTSRFRLQGTVEPGTIQRTEAGVDFVVTFNGAQVPVSHVGDPPELFKDAEPVVLEGHWDSAGVRFQSDRMLIKHDANYTAKNSDRLKEADEGGTVPPSTPSSVAS